MDRLLTDIEVASLVLAALIFAVMIALGYRELADRRHRPEHPTLADVVHYRRRDRRRSLGLSILSFLALGVVVGSRTPLRVGARPNPLFIAIWLAIFALIFVLLMLALVDWIALKHYAQHKKNAISREHLDRLRAEFDARSRSGDDPEP